VPDNIDYTRYLLGGFLTNEVQNSADVLYICYGTTEITTPGTNDWDTVVVIPVPARTNAPFTVVTPILEKETAYYARVYAGNVHGGTWSDIARFETGDEWPVGYQIGGGAEVIHVRLEADGSGDGSDWYNAFTSLNDAMLSVGGTRTNVWIAGGEYVLTANINTLPGINCAILGGFTGMEFSPEDRVTNAVGRAMNPTVIRGGGNRIVLNAPHGAMDNIQLTGFTVSSAFTRIGTGHFALSHCVATNNAFASGGGGVFVFGNPFVVGSGGSVTMAHCIVADNVTAQHSVSGLGVHAIAGTALSVFDCDFSRNRGTSPWDSREGYGFGIFFNGTTLLVERTRFSGNEIGAHAGTLNGGSALFLGGGVVSAVIRNCLFDNNQLVLGSHNTGSMNGRGNGSALFVTTGTILVENCTFAGNVSETRLSDDGAVYQGGGSLTVRNSIFWDNVWTNVPAGTVHGADVYASAGTRSFGYNSFASEAPPSVNDILPATTLFGDPLFADGGDYRLQSPFGRWDANLGDWEEDDYFSPCIDAGDPTDPVGDEPAPNGGRINLGAYGGTAEASKSFDASGVTVTFTGAASADFTKWEMSAVTAGAAGGICSVGFAYGTVPGATDSLAGWEFVTYLPSTQPVGERFSAFTHYLDTDTTYYVMAFVVADPMPTSTPIDFFTTGSLTPPGWGVGGGTGVVHVRKEAVTGNNDGSDWFNAFTSLEAGLATMDSERPTLWIGGGAYYPADAIVVTGGQGIVGGFAGTEDDPSKRARTAAGLIANPTVFDSVGIFRPIIAQTEDGDILLDAITLRRVTMTVNTPAHLAALTKTGTGTLTLADCTITENTLGANGRAGIGCRFDGGTVIMERCTVTENYATTWEIPGLALYAGPGTTLIMTDCDISRNGGNVNDIHGFWGSRDGRGGGLSFNGATLVAERTRFSGNTLCSHGSLSKGAALLVSAGDVTLKNCLFADNRVILNHRDAQGAGTGPAIHIDGGTVLVENCTFADNVTQRRSGGNAENSGAVHQAGGSLTVRNSIFWDNTLDVGSGDPVVINATLLADLFASGGTRSFGYNSFASEDPASVNMSDVLPATTLFGDPLFVGNGDYHLQSKEGHWDSATRSWKKSPENSPCIDAGDKADSVGDEPAPNGNRINLGAYGGTSFASKTQAKNTLILIR